MQAHNFFKIKSDKSIQLLLLSKIDCLSGLANLTSFERNLLSSQQFNGSLGDIGLINDDNGEVFKVYIGSGEEDSDTLAIANAVKFLPAGCYQSSEPLSIKASASWALAQYQFDKYRAVENTSRVLVVEKHEFEEVLAEADAIYLVRDLINTPTNDLGPKELSDVLANLAKEFKANFNEWVGDELLHDNFGAIHAVGRGSASAPRLLSMVWGDESNPRVTLVGKGVCFDSGGLDIKNSEGMRLMKKDMGGAANVIGLARWLMVRKVPIRLHVLIPAVENAVDGESYRPGDVLTMRNGLKVEIHNTDAEGRLVLADALVKACEERPDLIIDFATLTGAARVAVGTDISAMFVNNDNLANALIESSKITFDPIWRLPLFAGYNDLFSSSIADFTNASESGYAGAITAALFLQRFVDPNINWVHFDIMAWNLRSKPGKPEGGEAMGIMAVGHYLQSVYCN